MTMQSMCVCVSIPVYVFVYILNEQAMYCKCETAAVERGKIAFITFYLLMLGLCIMCLCLCGSVSAR